MVIELNEFHRSQVRVFEQRIQCMTRLHRNVSCSQDLDPLSTANMLSSVAAR
jgi:two-component sensor histidine kinase